MKKCILLLFCLFLPFVTKAQYSVSSPDMTAWVNLKTEKRRGINRKFLRSKKMKIDISVKGRSIVRNRDIGLQIYHRGRISSFGKSDMISCDYTTKTISTIDDSVFAEAGLKGKYYCMVLQSVAGINLEIVMFNNGMAYRFSTNGFDDDYEYKILDVTAVFPDDKPNAILGTFTDDTVLPWRTMLFNEVENQEKVTDEWETFYPHNKVVSWKDALSSASIGLTTNIITGIRWGKVSVTQGVSADFIYKHLYGGLSCSPCQELLYVFYAYDFDPFLGVMGSVRSWDVSCRFGYNLPVQNGYDIWSFAPYATATYLHLHQHGKIHPSYSDIYEKHHYLVGLGVKLQYMMRQRITFGVAYEYQLFTGWKEPFGRNTFTVTMGYGF